MSGHTPAQMLARVLGHADPEAPVVIDLGWMGTRQVRGYVIWHGGQASVRIETWREMRARLRDERLPAPVADPDTTNLPDGEKP